MNYSDCSDEQINEAVGEIWVIKNNKGVRDGLPDYCNNPSDAWPIILENRIATNPYTNPSKGWFAATDESLFADDSNPLRAAMIVYLMMQGE